MLAYQKMKSLSQENRSIVILNQEGWAKTLCPTKGKKSLPRKLLYSILLMAKGGHRIAQEKMGIE